jgi:hypothetical protein
MDSWDSRFHVIPTKDNHKYHDFFRMYFDKPINYHKRRLISPERKPELDPPNLKASLDVFSTRFPRRTRAVKRTRRISELAWDSRFQVSFSKDNDKYPRGMREYFDSPSPSNGSSRPYSSISTTGQRTSNDSPFVATGSNFNSTVRTSKSPRLRRKRTESFELSPSPVLISSSMNFKVPSELNHLKHPRMRSYFEHINKTIF